MIALALAVVLAAADATPAPDATPESTATPETTATPAPPPAIEDAAGSLARGSSVRLVLDDGSVVAGVIGDLSNLSILVRLPEGGFRVVPRARVVEPPEAKLAPAVIELRDAAIAPHRPAPLEPKKPAQPWGGFITAGLGPGTLGSGALGAFTIRYENLLGTFRYENRRERFTPREPPESNYSFGIVGGRAWTSSGELVRLAAEGGAGVIWGQERGGARFTEERDGVTWTIHDRERYRKPVLLGHVSASLHPRLGPCAPDSTGIGLSLSAAARSGGAEGLLLVFVQLGAL